MTRRKPGAIRFEAWIDRQIRQARERGEFADLPGAGAPLPDLGKPYDDMWWVKRKLRSENLSCLPPSLALRKEAHDALEGAARAKTEAEVRERITAINETIRDAIRRGGSAGRRSTSPRSTSSGSCGSGGAPRPIDTGRIRAGGRRLSLPAARSRA